MCLERSCVLPLAFPSRQVQATSLSEIQTSQNNHIDDCFSKEMVMCFHIGVVKREIYGDNSDLMPTVRRRFVETVVFINDGISSFEETALECEGPSSLLLP